MADIAAIMHYHRAEAIGHPNSTWGVLDDNPTQEQIQWNGSLLPVDFLVNVTLNRQGQITRYFCGEVMAAHREGCAFAKQTAMVPFDQPYPIVVTTNAGYPLDQNLYQAVKGMHAAMQVVEQDGFILAAARCNDGFPNHGNFRQLLFDAPTPAALLETITAPGFSVYDQWEAQLLAIIALRARVGLKSELDPADVRAGAPGAGRGHRLPHRRRTGAARRRAGGRAARGADDDSVSGLKARSYRLSAISYGSEVVSRQRVQGPRSMLPRRRNGLTPITQS